MRSSVLVAVFAGLLAIPTQAQEPAGKPIFKLQEVLIPVRDGVKLQTAILPPVDRHEPLSILFRRTPYGVPHKAPEQIPANLKELAQYGYIFVIQNLRGRFKSEGVFELPSQVDLSNPKTQDMKRRGSSAKTSRLRSSGITCTAKEAELAGQHFSEWFEQLAHVCGMASERSASDKFILARGWLAVLSRADRGGKRQSIS